MKKLRNSLALLATATAFALSLALFQRAVGPKSPWFGLMVMSAFLGLVAFARPSFRLRLPRFLQTEGEWELKGTLYKRLRVPAFGLLLRRTPLRHLNPVVYFSGDWTPPMVESQIESAEAAHYVAGVLLVPYIVYACAQGRWAAVTWLVAVQIGGNLYPILHLRWVRGRFERLRRRFERSNGFQRRGRPRS